MAPQNARSTVRNAITMNAFIPTTTHGGYTLLLGNNPSLAEAVRLGERWERTTFDAWTETLSRETEDMDEVTRDRYMRRRALRWMRENPRDAGRLALWLSLRLSIRN